MKKQLFSILFVILLLVTTGCAQGVQQLPTSVETVSNMFTRPSEETIQSTDDAANFQPYSFYFSHSFEQDTLIYEGGELRVPFRCAGGIGSKVGYLLLLDGQPQPYKLEPDGEYRYLHTITFTKAFAEIEFIFTPVAGTIGDTAELCAINVNDPAYRVSESGISGNMHTSGSIPILATVDFKASPAIEDMPSVDPDSLHTSVEYVDIAASDILGWSEDDLRNRSDYTISVNGSQNDSIFWNVAPNDPIHVHLELWGNPKAEFSVVFYLNNEPVTAIDHNTFHLCNQQGKKLKLDVEIDHADISEEAVLYAVIVCNNLHDIYYDNIQWFAEARAYYVIP